MENIALKMNYMGNFVKVIVEDVDKCLLMDVINDMYDEAIKHGMPLPTYPTLGYSFKMNSVKLDTDKDLTEMFGRFLGYNEIDIWIGEGVFPTLVLLSARKLRAINDGSHVSQPILDNSQRVFNGSSDGKKLVVRRSTNSSDQVSLPSNQLITTQNYSKKDVSTESQISVQKFKMPKATAKMKGIYVPKIHSSEVSNRESKSKSKRIRREGTIVFEADNVVESDESDVSYMVSDDEELDNDDHELDDLEVEDNIMISTLEYVDDGYIPYQGSVWRSDDEGYTSQLYENGEIYDSKEFGAIKLRPWMLFIDKDHFKDALRDFCIQEGFFLIVVKADNMRYTADCATLKCNWRIHASVLPDGTTWAIKSIRNPEHGCVGVESHNPMANAEWVARKLIEDIRANHDISAKSIQSLLMDRFGLQMKPSTLYKMKDLALKEINGGHDESYSQLPRYCEMIKVTNKGSVAHCSWAIMEEVPEKPLQFRSIFVSFYAQFKGLITGCRSLIGVDGTHLKGNHGGILLSAIALDGNNELFPVAVGVVDSEGKDSWSNFLWHLKQLLKESGRDDWTIISDRQKGVEPAMDHVWPEANRRYCARHMCRNFKTLHKGMLMHQIFWRVVNATSEFTFKKAMEMLIQHGGKDAAKWFFDLGDKDQWTKHKFDPKLSSDENTSNFVESFNSTLGMHRCLPVLSLLEGVRRIAMVRHATRQQVADSWPDDGVCPNILNRLRVLKKDSRTCHAYPSTHGEFEVHDGQSHLHVSLNNRTCACGQWQISGIPCKHAIRAIIVANKDPVDYVNSWFSVRRYKASYELPINPIPDIEQWGVFDVPSLLPPTVKRSIGRPNRNRRREEGEQRKGKRSLTIKCKKCKCFGHNSRTCKGGYTAKQKAEMLGKVPKKRSKVTLSTAVTLYHSLDQLERDVMTISQNDERTTAICNTQESTSTLTQKTKRTKRKAP